MLAVLSLTAAQWCQLLSVSAAGAATVTPLFVRKNAFPEVKPARSCAPEAVEDPSDTTFWSAAIVTGSRRAQNSMVKDPSPPISPVLAELARRWSPPPESCRKRSGELGAFSMT